VSHALIYSGLRFTSWFGWLSDEFARHSAPPDRSRFAWMEDAFVLLLSATSIFILVVVFQLFVFAQRRINVRSRTWMGFIHIHTGWLQVIVTLYAVYLERVFRLQPGPVWGMVSWLVALGNVLTMFPLVKELHAPPLVKFLFRLGFSFISSFQGIHM